MYCVAFLDEEDGGHDEDVELLGEVRRLLGVDLAELRQRKHKPFMSRHDRCQHEKQTIVKKIKVRLGGRRVRICYYAASKTYTGRTTATTYLQTSLVRNYTYHLRYSAHPRHKYSMCSSLAVSGKNRVDTVLIVSNCKPIR